MFPPRMLFAIAMAAAALTSACVTSAEDEPTPDELDDLDGWVVTSDGKADLPNTFSEAVAWVKDVYLNDMSAVWNNQEHPATADVAIARVRGLMQQAGLDATTQFYPTRVQRLVTTTPIDHSEIDVTLAPGKVIRLVGDPKGAGVFVDTKLFAGSIGPKLCLSWSELVTAIRTSYATGYYGASFVCHTITERVLRALDANSSVFANQIRTYQTARWVWGPLLPSFDPKNASDWAISRSCPR